MHLSSPLTSDIFFQPCASTVWGGGGRGEEACGGQRMRERDERAAACRGIWRTAFCPIVEGISRIWQVSNNGASEGGSLNEFDVAA